MAPAPNSDVLYELHRGELIAQSMFFQGEADGGTRERLIAPGSSGTLVLDIGNFASEGGIVDTTTFRGSLTLIGLAEGRNTSEGQTPARAFGPNSLVMGYVFGWGDDAMPPRFRSPPTRSCSAVTIMVRVVPTWSMLRTRSAGVGDVSQFVAATSCAVAADATRSLQPAAAGVTNVQLYRVGASLVKSGIRIVGSAGSSANAR